MAQPLPPEQKPSPQEQVARRAVGFGAMLMLLGFVIGLSCGAVLIGPAWPILARFAAAGQPAAVQADEQAVLSLVNTQVQAWNRGDLEQFLTTYWQDERLTFSSGGDLRQGFAATRDRYFARYKNDGKEMGRLDFTEITVDRLALDVALVKARWRLKFSQAPDQLGLFSLIVRRFPEGWRIVHDHTSRADPEPKSASGSQAPTDPVRAKD